MKLDKKNIILLALVGVIFIALAVILSDKEDNDDIIILTPSPATSINPSISPTVSIVASPTKSPKPDVIIEEVKNYQYWFSGLDYQNRVLGIYSECSLLVPSNVTYKNNTTVMLDNTRSTKAHVLKIGDKNYSLQAEEWQIVNLSSQTLPVKMPIFCEGIELGQIDLE